MGTIIISEVKEYLSKDDWELDRPLHMVPVESEKYNWSPDESNRQWGWMISSVNKFNEDIKIPPMKRGFRSFFDCGPKVDSSLLYYNNFIPNITMMMNK